MGRSERYIPPSREELRRLQEAERLAEQLERGKVELLRAALKRMRKADLVELALRIAREEKASEWLLEGELALDKPVQLLVHDVTVAMAIATRAGDALRKYNFDYDWRAYEAARRGLEQLIEKQALEEARLLALELMAKGSYQIAASDEGLMREEIESCLRPVISAVAASPAAAARDWALQMLQADRVGAVCRSELEQLAQAIR